MTLFRQSIYNIIELYIYNSMLNNKGFLILSLFLLGVLFIITNKQIPYIELFGNNNECPNILIQKDNYVYLYNSKAAKIPGINPVRFNNLEDYVEYTKWQRSQKIVCPVLFLQHSYNSQGKAIYKQKPNPVKSNNILAEQSKLIDANHNDPPYNRNSVPGYDPQDQYIGLVTPLDKKFHNENKISPNPMDSNWGGGEYTDSLVHKGIYKGNDVYIKPA